MACPKRHDIGNGAQAALRGQQRDRAGRGRVPPRVAQDRAGFLVPRPLFQPSQRLVGAKLVQPHRRVVALVLGCGAMRVVGQQDLEQGSKWIGDVMLR